MKLIQTQEGRLSKTKVTSALGMAVGAVLPVVMYYLYQWGIEAPEGLVEGFLLASGSLLAWFIRDGMSRGD